MKIVIALIIFSLIIIFHELGHYFLAKANKITVVEFSLGLGPTLFGFTAKGTKWSIKLLPFGGACQMLGEDNGDNAEGAFNSKNVWQRMSVVLAGPFFNFIMAFILSIVLIALAGYVPPVATGVEKNGPAANAGIQNGDIITKIGNQKVSTGSDIGLYFDFTGIDKTPVEVTYKHDGVKKTVTLEPVKFDKYLLGISYNPNVAGYIELLEVGENSAFAEAGIVKGDYIVSINGVEMKNGTDFSAYINECPLNGTPIVIEYLHNGEKLKAEVTPKLAYSGYTLGFSGNQYRAKASFGQVIRYSFSEVRYWIQITFKSLGMLITGQAKSDDIGGPVAIVGAIGDTYEETKKTGSALDVFLSMIYICILLSANLGVMNLLPIPALDGGRELFLIVEAIKRKPLNREREGFINFIGLMLLLVLMILIFFNDIRKLIMGI